MSNPWEKVPDARPENQPAVLFDHNDFQELLRDYADGRLPLNIAQDVLKGVRLVRHHGVWESSANRGEKTVNIGLEAVPRDTAMRWGWGVYEAADQVHVKAAHEYAHHIQDFFDRDLEAFLDSLRVISRGEASAVKHFIDAGLEDVLEKELGKVRELSQDYIRLYLSLAKTGRISGLPEEDVYKKQTEKQQARGSLLDMQTYEDAAEVVGAWLLGEKYLDFRLDNAKTALTPEQRAHLLGLVEKIFETWALNRSRERS